MYCVRPPQTKAKGRTTRLTSSSKRRPVFRKKEMNDVRAKAAFPNAAALGRTIGGGKHQLSSK